MVNGYCSIVNDLPVIQLPRRALPWLFSFWSTWLGGWGRSLSSTIVNRPFTIDNSSGACTPAASHPANASSGTLTAEEWQDNLFRLSNPVWLSPLHSSRPALSRLPASFPLRFLVQPLQPGGWVTSTLGVELFARSPELSLKIRICRFTAYTVTLEATLACDKSLS